MAHVLCRAAPSAARPRLSPLGIGDAGPGPGGRVDVADLALRAGDDAVFLFIRRGRRAAALARGRCGAVTVCRARKPPVVGTRNWSTRLRRRRALQVRGAEAVFDAVVDGDPLGPGQLEAKPRVVRFLQRQDRLAVGRVWIGSGDARIPAALDVVVDAGIAVGEPVEAAGVVVLRVADGEMPIVGDAEVGELPLLADLQAMLAEVVDAV